MPLQKGVNLTLDRILTAPTDEPEQLARRESLLSKIRSLSQRIQATPPPQTPPSVTPVEPPPVTPPQPEGDLGQRLADFRKRLGTRQGITSEVTVSKTDTDFLKSFKSFLGTLTQPTGAVQPIPKVPQVVGTLAQPPIVAPVKQGVSITDKDLETEYSKRMIEIGKKYPQAPYTREQMAEPWYKEMMDAKDTTWHEYQNKLAEIKPFEKSLAGRTVAFLGKGLEQTTTEMGALLTAPFRYKGQPLKEYLAIYPGMKGYEEYQKWIPPSLPLGIPSWQEWGEKLGLAVNKPGYQMAGMNFKDLAELVPWLFIPVGKVAALKPGEMPIKTLNQLLARQGEMETATQQATKIIDRVMAGEVIPEAELAKMPTGASKVLRNILEQIKKPIAGEVGGLKVPLVEPIPPEMSATQKVFSRISLAQKEPGITEKIEGGWNKFNTAMLDDLYPIQKFVTVAKQGGEKIGIEENPYIWARILRGNVSKANIMLEQGTFGKDYWKMVEGKAVPNFKGLGLTQILEPVKEPTTLRDFTTYLTSQRSVELSGRNIKTGIKLADAKTAIKELETKYPDFPKIAEDIYKYQNDVLDYTQEMGLLSKELATRLKTSKAYVPFYRVFDDLASRGFMGKKMANVISPIRRIKGSERMIINPLESIVKNTHLLVDAADRNQVGIMMANLVDKNPELAPLFLRVRTPIARVAQVTADQLGITIEGLTKGETEKVFNIFRPSMFTKKNVVSVLIDGKKAFFKVDPDLYKGLLNLDRESMGMMGRVLSYPAKWLRAGATLSPDFMVRNPLRDQMTAFTYSNYGFIPGVDFLRGIASILGKDDYYQLYKMSGAERSMLVSMDREYLQSSFQQIVKGKGFIDYVKHPLDLFQIASELGEKGTRLGEFARGIKAGATPLEAGMSAREVSLDFGKMGTTARAVNSLIAFFNANIRGWDKLITMFKTQPVRTSAKVFAGITLPSMLLYLANREDPRWKEIPQWQKDLFWIVMTKDHIYRIPKPFELGVIFGSMPERFMEFMDNKDPDMFKEAIANVVQVGSPGFLPTALLPIIENLTNYSFFRGAPIVSAGKVGMPPALQYGGTTSEVSKKLGELVNYSPAKIDNIINGYTGGLGRYATDALDVILKGTGIASNIPQPSPVFADLPVLKAFTIRDPYGSSGASVDKFYKKLTKYEEGEKYLKEMLKIGDEKKFNNYKASHPEFIVQFDWQTGALYSVPARYLRQVSGQLSDLRGKQNDVYNSLTMSPTEKRQKVDEINKLMTELTNRALLNLKRMSGDLEGTPLPKEQTGESIDKTKEWEELRQRISGGG